VTLFASGDSVTSARLISTCRRSLRLDPDCVDQIAHHLVMLEEVFRRADDFDVIHFHVDYFHFPWSRRYPVRHLTTLHGRLDLPDLVPLYREYAEMPVVSISNDQRKPLPRLNWLATVHHGLPPDLHSCGSGESGGYLVFLGRVSPEKGLDRAIEIAGRAGLPLKIAAKVDKADQEYCEQIIRPLLDQSHVDFVGEVGEEEKGELLGRARALLFPIDWPEPFGMVMIEAMACGTPVIAFRRGSVSEVMVDGRSGFVCDNVDEAVAAVGRLSEISRQEVRRVFEERFTVERMARDYVAIYQRLLKEDRTNADPRSVGALLDSGYGTAGR
jgi:glycosyltransferase involved in cell wall biosynthesis